MPAFTFTVTTTDYMERRVELSLLGCNEQGLTHGIDCIPHVPYPKHFATLKRRLYRIQCISSIIKTPQYIISKQKAYYKGRESEANNIKLQCAT